MRYRVPLQTTATAIITVEADNPDEAVEAALDQTPDLCAYCSGYNDQDYTFSLDDLWENDEEPILVEEGD
jgi:hypothetical protein